MGKFNGPLAVITSIFDEPFSDIKLNLDTTNFDNLQGVLNDIYKIEDNSRNELGLPLRKDVRAINLGARRPQLHDSMKHNSKFRDLFKEVIRYSGIKPKGTLEQQISAAYLPDWNELTARLLNLEISKGHISADFGVGHSYSTQLNRKGLLKKGTFKPVSVYGNVLTNDGKVMLGIRGGMSIPGAHMPVPSGSFSLYEGQPTIKNPVDAFKRELNEENGLVNEEAGFIGTFVERTSHDTVGLVYLVKTNKTSEELHKLWEKNWRLDKQEHDEVFFKSQKSIPDYIMSKSERRVQWMSDADPTYPLLPSGAATLLVQLARTNKREFGKVMESLASLYKLDKNTYRY